jgi:2-dehydro-3-deoxygluconokinase
MFDLTTIGEGQIRLTVPHGERLSRTRQLRVSAACSEANVSGVLAQLGRRTSWCSVLPTGDLAERCLSEYRAVGVDTSNVIRTADHRVALYFMEPGEVSMPSKVVYDRGGTSFREISIEDVNWESMLDTRLVFVTGITAALTDRTAASGPVPDPRGRRTRHRCRAGRGLPLPVVEPGTGPRGAGPDR